MAMPRALALDVKKSLPLTYTGSLCIILNEKNFFIIDIRIINIDDSLEEQLPYADTIFSR